MVARVVCVEEHRVELTNSRETILDNPVTPVTAALAMASLGPRAPNSVSKHRAKGSGVGRNVRSSTYQVVEVAGGWVRKVQQIVNVGNGCKDRRAVPKDVRSRVNEMRAEATAKVSPMSTRVGENHVMGDRDNIEPSVGRDPGRGPSMVAEKVCCISRKKTHDSTFFVNVLTKRDNALSRVDHRSISLSGGGARL
jgi:hypothetical protein